MKSFFEFLLSSPSLADLAVVCVRKSIHVAFYSLLAISLMGTWKAFGESIHRSRWTALSIALLIGSTDEFRQSLVPGRTGQWQDVLLDMSGAFAFTWLFANWMKRKDASSRP